MKSKSHHQRPETARTLCGIRIQPGTKLTTGLRGWPSCQTCREHPRSRTFAHEKREQKIVKPENIIRIPDEVKA